MPADSGGLLATVPANVNLRTFYSFAQVEGICKGNGMEMRDSNANWGSLCPAFFAKTLMKQYKVNAWDYQDWRLKNRFPRRGVACVLYSRPACK